MALPIPRGCLTLSSAAALDGEPLARVFDSVSPDSCQVT